MKLVRQEEKCGCTIACIAMVTGKTYADIRKDWETDFDAEGIMLEHTLNYLGDAGFSLLHKHSRNYNHKDDHRKELLRPFAPMHIVRILPAFDSVNGHVVVMDAKGKIYCPGGLSDKEIRSAYAVTDSIGLWKTK